MTLQVQQEELGHQLGDAHPQALFSPTSKSICNPSVISGALLISAFNRSGPYCAGSLAPRPWGQTVMNESDILVTQAPKAWHPMEKGSTEACKWFPSLDPWGIQTNPSGSGIPCCLPSACAGPASIDQASCLSLPHPPGHRGSFIHCPCFLPLHLQLLAWTLQAHS